MHQLQDTKVFQRQLGSRFLFPSSDLPPRSSTFPCYYLCSNWRKKRDTASRETVKKSHADGKEYDIKKRKTVKQEKQRRRRKKERMKWFVSKGRKGSYRRIRTFLCLFSLPFPCISHNDFGIDRYQDHPPLFFPDFFCVCTLITSSSSIPVCTLFFFGLPFPSLFSRLLATWQFVVYARPSREREREILWLPFVTSFHDSHMKWCYFYR